MDYFIFRKVILAWKHYDKISDKMYDILQVDFSDSEITDCFDDIISAVLVTNFTSRGYDLIHEWYNNMNLDKLISEDFWNGTVKKYLK